METKIQTLTFNKILDKIGASNVRQSGNTLKFNVRPVQTFIDSVVITKVGDDSGYTVEFWSTGLNGYPVLHDSRKVADIALVENLLNTRTF